jgi:hypothetical protein
MAKLTITHMNGDIEEIVGEQLELGKALKDGFDEGIKGTREKANVFAEKIREILIPPTEK